MTRLTFAVCLLSALASAPAFADCAGMASTSTGSTTTTASTPSDHKGG
ncbi:MAG: hypothetical protein H2042_18960 [Rhizobiales bacterium]|jgi:hypothetical protein|nr:hypothetical protein [Hyphomicrobiales bacterium]